MISFIVRTDVHISDRAPESRTDDYLETTLGKLRQIGDMARARKVDAVLDNGDFFHNKSASKNSHHLVKRIIEVHGAYPCPVYENPGNHDFPYGNVEYVERQPLSVLFTTGVFRRMTDHIFTDSTGLKVRVLGFPYKIDFNVLEFDVERGDEDVLIVCAHTYASPTGTESFGREKFLSYRELAECSPDLFVFGHYHVDQGIQNIGGKVFMNLGSLTRGSLTHDNLQRIPRVGYIKIDRGPDGDVRIETEALPLDVRPASEVFDLQKHEQIKRERKDIDSFVETLSRNLSLNDRDDIKTAIAGLPDYGEDVRGRALQYLERAADVVKG